jgi:hypothetical protein
MSESEIQQSFFEWIELACPSMRKFIFHIPNGGKMSFSRGKKLKKMGVRSGVADVLLMWNTKDFGGLWLEFKTGKGKQSEEQKKFEEDAFIALYDYQVVRSLDQAIEVFERYLNFGKNKEKKNEFKRT